MTAKLWFESFDWPNTYQNPTTLNAELNARGITTNAPGGMRGTTGVSVAPWDTSRKVLRLEPASSSATTYYSFSPLVMPMEDTCSFEYVWSGNDLSNPSMYFTTSGGSMDVYADGGTIRVRSSNSDSANAFDIREAIPPSAANHIGVVWSPTELKIYCNNSLLMTRPWTVSGVRPSHIRAVGYSGQTGYLGDMVYSPTRLGMVSIKTLTLDTPSIDTGTETGAASPQLALASFDGDTSYYTVANASGEKVSMALSDLPVTPDTIHGVKVTTQSRKTDSGSITGTVLMKTGSENDIGVTNDAIGYAGTQLVQAVDPHTAAAFTESAINSMEIGFKEGA